MKKDEQSNPGGGTDQCLPNAILRAGATVWKLALPLCVLLAGWVSWLWYYDHATVEILFADYHHMLPRIERLLSGGFSLGLINFQNAGHFHPSLAAECLLNAYLFRSSAFFELILCLCLVGTGYVFLIATLQRQRRADGRPMGKVALLLASVALGLVLFNLNKWEHLTFPFTGIEYFLTLAVFPPIAWWIALILGGSVRFGGLKGLAFALLFVAAILGFSGGRGPIICAIVSFFALLGLACPGWLNMRASRLACAMLLMLGVGSLIIYNSLLEHFPLPAFRLSVQMVVDFVHFYLNLFASELFGNGFLGMLPSGHPFWVYGLLMLVLMWVLVLTNRQRALFPTILFAYGMLGALFITLGRHTYGPAYAQTSKYLPVLDIALVAVIWMEFNRKSGARPVLVAIGRIMLAIVLIGGFCISHHVESRIAPHRKNLYIGISKFYFAPSFYSDYSRYLSPDKSVAQDVARIIRDLGLSSARRTDLWCLGDFNSASGLMPDGKLARMTTTQAKFFLYRQSPPVELVLGIVSGSLTPGKAVLTIDGAEHAIEVHPGNNLYIFPHSSRNAECVLEVPQISYADYRLFSFIN